MGSGDNKEKALFDSYGTSYDAWVNDALGAPVVSVDYFTNVKAEYLISAVSERLGPPEKLSALDIGCGVGNFEVRLGNKFRSLTGIDISSESLRIAQQRNPDNRFCIYDGKELPFSDAIFDMIFTVCVMHHVPSEDWDVFIGESYRALRPGGIFVIFEHNRLNPLTRRIVNRCPFDVDAVLVAQGDLEARLSRAGFQSINLRHILTVPAGSQIGRRVDRVFSRLPLGAQYYAVATKPGS